MLREFPDIKEKMRRILRVIKVFLREGIQVWLMFITYLPGQAGFVLRRRYWRKRLRFLGEGTKIDIGVYFQNPEHISIGENCWIDRGVILLAGPDGSKREKRYRDNPRFPLKKGMLHIGKNVHIGPGSIISAIGGVYISDNCGFSSAVKAYSFSNHFRSIAEPWNRDFCFGIQAPHSRQCIIEGPIFFAENVGVALNAVILPGVTIGRDSFVAINSVVKDSFGENSLIAGNPARRVGDRFLNEREMHDE